MQADKAQERITELETELKTMQDNYNQAAQVWNKGRTTKFADFTTTYTDRSAGSVSISLTDTQTATFTQDFLYYDVLLTNSSGFKEYYLEGIITVSEGYTA